MSWTDARGVQIFTKSRPAPLFVRICKRVQAVDRPIQDKIVVIIVVVILSVPGLSRYSRFSLTRFMMSSKASGGLAPEKPTFLLRIKKGTPFMFSRLARA